MLRRLTTLLLALTLAATAAAGSDEYLRPAAKAGTWYPAQKEVLHASLQTMLAAANPPRVEGRLYALIVPHAGHIYSGRVAAAAYALLARQEPTPRTVILVGPSHHYPLSRPSVWPRGAYACPLGEMPVDAALAGELSRLAGARFVRQAHLPEHCLEVQVPFIQHCNAEARIVPIVVGPVSFEECELAARDLVEAIRNFPGPVLIVASTDMTHYESRENAAKKDHLAMDHISALDPEGLYRTVLGNRITMCGVIPTTITLVAAAILSASTAELIRYTDSGEVSGDTAQVVGYAGFVIS